MVKVAKIGLTIVAFVQGQMLQKTLSSTDEVLSTYEKIINAQDENEVVKILTPQPIQAEIEFHKKMEAKKQELENTKAMATSVLDKTYKGKKIFEQKDTSIYMVDINLSIPKFLAEAIAATNDEKQLEALINFWKLCAMNPDPRAREDLFKFLSGGKFTVTPMGYFVAYRNVLVKEKAKKSNLSDFVQTNWLKVKGWKKSPQNFGVGKTANGTYILLKKGKDKTTTSYEYVGNLQDLYKNPTKETSTVYTDQYTRTFHIEIGKLVQMERKKCNSDPKQDCSYGLHVGNKSFLNKGNFGNVGLAVLVNPSKVVAVPEYNHNKMRVCEYLPMGVVEYDKQGKLIEIDTSLFESDYCDYDMKVINEMIKKTGFAFEELKKNELIPYEINHKVLGKINLSLKEANDMVKQRVKKV